MAHRGHRSPKGFVRRFLVSNGFYDRSKKEMVVLNVESQVLRALAEEYELDSLEPEEKEFTWKYFEGLAKEFVRGEVLLDSRGSGSLQRLPCTSRTHTF